MSYIMTANGYVRLVPPNCIPPAREPVRGKYNGESPDNVMPPWHQNYDAQVVTHKGSK